MTARPSRRAFLTGAAALAAGAALAAAGCSSSDSTATDAGTVGPTTAGSTDTMTAPASTAPAASSTVGHPTIATSTTAAATTGNPTTTSPVTARFVDRAPNPGQQVALTFHTNGDLTLAQRLLDTIKAHDTVVTCFIVGNWLDANPTWAKKLLDAGHELANHTYSHPDSTKLAASTMESEIVRCRDVLRTLTGNGGRFFRPSGTDDGTADPGKTIIDAAGKAGYATVAGFDVDPFDYKDPGAAAVGQRTLDGVRGGSIISLHFGHPGTIEAMPGILDGLKTKNLQPVTLSQLLG